MQPMMKSHAIAAAFCGFGELSLVTLLGAT
jgi:hypothetical protein